MLKNMSLTRNKIAMLGSAALLTAAMVILPSVNSVVKADTEYTIYVSVDQSVLGGPSIIKPVKFTTDDTNKTMADVLDAVKGDIDVNILYGSYLAGVESTGTSSTDINSVTYQLNSTTYPMFSTLTDGAKDAHMINTNYNDGMLSEKEFTATSGWMLAIDDQTTGTRTSDSSTVYYGMGTKIADLLDTGILGVGDTSAVIRCYYSLNMGADLGITGSSYLPTNAATYDTTTNRWAFNWGVTESPTPLFTKANKAELIKTMANDPTNAAYAAALVVLDKVNATPTEVQAAIDAFEF